MRISALIWLSRASAPTQITRQDGVFPTPLIAPDAPIVIDATPLSPSCSLTSPVIDNATVALPPTHPAAPICPVADSVIVVVPDTALGSTVPAPQLSRQLLSQPLNDVATYGPHSVPGWPSPVTGTALTLRTSE